MNLSFCSFDHEVTKYLDIYFEGGALSLQIQLTSELDEDYIDQEQLDAYLYINRQKNVELHFKDLWLVGSFLSGLLFSARRNNFKSYLEGKEISLSDALRQTADILDFLAGATRREDADWYVKEEDCAEQVDELLDWFPESSMS